MARYKPAHGVLIVKRRAARGLRDVNRSGNFNAAVQDAVLGFAPHAQTGQDFGSVRGSAYALVLNGDQGIPHMDPSLFSWAVRGNVHSRDAARGRMIHPGNAVVGQVEPALLLEIDSCGDNRRHRHDDQQSVSEL